MATPNQPRKFAVVPVEESTKSSKERSAATATSAKPRRFAPEPVEQSVKSSKDAATTSPAIEKVKPKRFAPEPVEHSTKSSKGARQQPPGQDEKPKPRKFAPQLVDESEESSKNRSQAGRNQHVKFKPEPVATTYGSNRRAKRQDEEPTKTSVDVESEKKPPRKFTPILLDTARRSRRAGDPNAPLAQDYRTEYGYHAHPHEHWKRVTGQVTPRATSEAEGNDDQNNGNEISPVSTNSSQRRKLAPLDGSAPSRSRCLAPERTHSFRMPELDTIESSESEDGSIASSTPPTPRQESSPITVSDSHELFKHATRRRESIDDDWQHYLLDLERTNARKRLEEQALAAYPNPDFGYEHANHYFVDEDDSEDFEIEERPVTWEGNDDDLLEMARRESAANVAWEQREMQRHAEENQQERNANKVTAKKSIVSPFMKQFGLIDTADAELRSMRERARPPMLGNDLVFPRCASPDPARFDVTQSSATLRSQMCYLTATAEAETTKKNEEGALWQAPTSPVKNPISMVQPSVSAQSTTSKGLWGGFCTDEGETNTNQGGLRTPKKATGLMTPKHEAPNPFQLAVTEGRPVGVITPSTPSPKKKIENRNDLTKINSMLVTEREIDSMMENEYPDSFIAQVYNYLSLGYPSLARPFDEELSKISRISVAELRQDDEKAKATPRGYIRLGTDFEGGGGEGLMEDSCVRWQALKRYVREWARQEKNMLKSDGVGGTWGTGARRGSWGI